MSYKQISLKTKDQRIYLNPRSDAFKQAASVTYSSQISKNTHSSFGFSGSKKIRYSQQHNLQNRYTNITPAEPPYPNWEEGIPYNEDYSVGEPIHYEFQTPPARFNLAERLNNLTPGNYTIRMTGDYKETDFGFVKNSDGSSSLFNPDMGIKNFKSPDDLFHDLSKISSEEKPEDIFGKNSFDYFNQFGFENISINKVEDN